MALQVPQRHRLSRLRDAGVSIWLDTLSRELLDTGAYPPGTRFLLNAKLTDRNGGEPFLYAWHGDPVVVLSAAQARKFLAEFRRGRI